MSKLSQLMDLRLLADMIDQRMINVTEHPGCSYRVLNYSHACQYTPGSWNEATRQCRGLIVSEHPLLDPMVVARSMPKFHNVVEHESENMDALPTHRPFEVTAKLDGSLGVGYSMPDGSPAIATRGSFTSEQALWATEFYRRNHGHEFNDEVTLLFEIIFPSNRIVVDYGDREDLVLLAVIHKDTGADLPLSTAVWWEGPVVERFDGMNDLDAIVELCKQSPDDYANQEGYVIRFVPEKAYEPSVRAKCKYSEYQRLHKILTGVNAKTIWELLANGQGFDELIELVPDEFYDWVKRTADELTTRYEQIDAAATSIFELRPKNASRKELAELWSGLSDRALLFRMLDGREYSTLIWKMIKPVAEKPFREDIDS